MTRRANICFSNTVRSYFRGSRAVRRSRVEEGGYASAPSVYTAADTPWKAENGGRARPIGTVVFYGWRRGERGTDLTSKARAGKTATTRVGLRARGSTTRRRHDPVSMPLARQGDRGGGGDGNEKKAEVALSPFSLLRALLASPKMYTAICATTTDSWTYYVPTDHKTKWEA